MSKFEATLKAYSDRFDNLDELMHPAYVANPDFIAFLQSAIDAGKKATLQDAESKWGKVDWEW